MVSTGVKIIGVAVIIVGVTVIVAVISGNDTNDVGKCKPCVICSFYPVYSCYQVTYWYHYC